MKNKNKNLISKILIVFVLMFLFIPFVEIKAEYEYFYYYRFMDTKDTTYTTHTVTFRNKNFAENVLKENCEKSYDLIKDEKYPDGTKKYDTIPCSRDRAYIIPDNKKDVSEDFSINSYKLLEPLPGLEDYTINPDGCPLEDYLKIVFKLVLGIIAVISVVMIVYGGVEYMTSELVSSKSSAKNTIMNALFGLLLGLSAWLILETINPYLLDLCLKLEEVTVQIDEVKEDSVPQEEIGGKFCVNTAGANGGYDRDADWAPIAGSTLIIKDDNFINFNNSECSYVGQKNCTSTAGLKPTIINTIYKNREKYKISNITITGGTECWEHGGKTQNTTHRPGSPSIDLRFETNLDKYIKSGKNLGNNWYLKDGVKYLLESNHWHAQL